MTEGREECRDVRRHVGDETGQSGGEIFGMIEVALGCAGADAMLMLSLSDGRSIARRYARWRMGMAKKRAWEYAPWWQLHSGVLGRFPQGPWA